MPPTTRDDDKDRAREQKKQSEDQVPTKREPRDEEPFWDASTQDVPDEDHVITHPTRARRPVDRK